MKPYCFIDWDGVGNAIRGGHENCHVMECEGYTIRIPNDFGPNLARIVEVYDPVWLTTWEHLANKHYNPHFGYEPWPVIEWRSAGHTDHPDFKILAMVEWMQVHGERPFCFIDDQAHYEVDELKRRDWYLHEKVSGPYLLLHPQDWVGLTTEETDTALKFAEENS